MARSRFRLVVVCGLLLPACGCHQWFINQADREVYELIESRQQAALGETHPVDIGTETGDLRHTDDMYRFAPHPVDSRVPEAFREATAPRDQEPSPAVVAQEIPEADTTTQPTTQPTDTVITPDFPDTATLPAADALVFTLADALAYGQRHSREFQSAKEDLYLSALALSLERFLWTPQLSSQLSYEFADYGQVRDFDRAMTATASLAAEQRLPLGGTITAQVIDSWMRDLKVHTTSGETGTMILSADIPLLRGAGRVAYESRYQAERNLIYAVRSFERFRREFLVDIASDYFALLSSRAQIDSAEAQADALIGDWERARALTKAEFAIKLDEDRARVEYLRARNQIVAARERYGTSLDQFKIRLGMSTETPLEVSKTDVELYKPEVTEAEAIAAALRYRLDLLTTLDGVDDARRGVEIARNNMLPDFDFSGSVTMNTKPYKLNVVEYNSEHTTWRGLVELEVPLNRQAERNDLRAAFVDLRRAERGYEQSQDQIRAEVRRTIRRIDLAEFTLVIQQEQIGINEFRRAQARTLLALGEVSSNRDVIDAENDLRDARNAYAEALAGYRTAILEFLLATGTLRVDDNGRWVVFEEDSADSDEAAGDS